MYKKIELPQREMQVLQSLRKGPQTVKSLTDQYGFFNMPEYIRRLRNRPDICIRTKWRRSAEGMRYAEYSLEDCNQYVDSVRAA